MPAQLVVLWGSAVVSFVRCRRPTSAGELLTRETSLDFCKNRRGRRLKMKTRTRVLRLARAVGMGRS